MKEKTEMKINRKEEYEIKEKGWIKSLTSFIFKERKKKEFYKNANLCTINAYILGFNF